MCATIHSFFVVKLSPLSGAKLSEVDVFLIGCFIMFIANWCAEAKMVFRSSFCFSTEFLDFFYKLVTQIFRLDHLFRGWLEEISVYR